MKLLELMMEACPRAASWLWRASWQAAVVVIAVLLAQWVFRRVLTPRWRHALWFLVLARLLVPAGPASSASIFNFVEFNGAAKGQATGGVPENSRALRRIQITSPKSTSAHDNRNIDLNPAQSSAHLVNQSQSPLDLFRAVALGAGLLGFIATLLWMGIANRRFWRRVRTTSVPVDLPLRRAYTRCCEELGLKAARAPKLIVTSAITSPALGGMLRPCVLLPERICEALLPSQIRLVLLHELIHFTCGDHWLNWIWTMMNALHWFNPVLWLARSRCAADRELSRDAMVLQQAGNESVNDYGSALIRLLEISNGRARHPGIVAMAQSNGRIRERIVMIAGFKRGSVWRSAPGIAVVLLVGCAALTGPRPAANSSSAAPSNTAPIATTTPDATVDAGKTVIATSGHSSTTLITRVYDMRDLLAAPQTNKPPADSLEQQPTQQLLDIRKKIEAVIEFDTWKDNNPKAFGQITVYKNSLIVTAVADVQAQIGRLLSQLRDVQAVQVIIEARFISTPSSQAKLDQLLMSKLAAKDGKPGNTVAILPADDLNEMLRALNQDKESSITHAPRITVHNGEGAKVVDETSIPYVAGVDKKPSGNEFIYTPVIAEAHDGVELEIRRAVASADHKYATVNFKAQGTHFMGFLHKTDPADTAIKFDVPMLEIRAVDSAILLSSDQLLLISMGQRAQAGDAEKSSTTRHGVADAQEQTTQRTYLVLKARVVVNGEADAQAPPESTSSPRP